MTRRPTASIVASPVLVGAVTLLVAIVSVFLAYNANRGLPFVPTYDVKVQLHGGENLVRGNDVRVGGFRVGLVKEIETATDPKTGKAIAVVNMKLDKAIEPLPVDTRVLVRPRSPLGLKFIELTPGHSRRMVRAGGTISLANASAPVELDEFFSTFNAEFRRNQRTALEGYGTAFAGRGQSLNRAIEQLVPFTRHLEPVFRALADPDTRLAQFFLQARRFSGQVAPVAATYSRLFTNMATTFEALSRNPLALQQTIERSAPTLDAGIRSFPVQRPFLADSEILFQRLEPVMREMTRSLPAVVEAFQVGEPVLTRTPDLYTRTRKVLQALRALVRNPNTLLALKDLGSALQVAAPLLTYIAPYQTVCNYWNYYWTGLSEHISEHVRGGTIQRVQIKLDDRNQDNRLGDSLSERPVDLPKDTNPQSARGSTGTPLQALHTQNYMAAIDAQGNADCENGQRGYLNRLVTDGRYPPSNDSSQLGGSHVVLDSNLPGLSGPTYTGVPSLKDVP